jgi:hypothetical protein
MKNREHGAGMVDTLTNYAALLKLMGRDAEAAKQLRHAENIRSAHGAVATPPLSS